jgi:urease accessory protein
MRCLAFYPGMIFHQQWRKTLFVVCLLLSAPALRAHSVASGAFGFSNGFWHPFSGWDHVAAMVAVGVWGAQLGVPMLWVLPVAFPFVMAIGGVAGMLRLPLPGLEVGIGLSALVLGAMIACQIRPRTPVLPVALVGAFGFYHGHAHGAELPTGIDSFGYSLGFVVATGCLHAGGIGLGVALGSPGCQRGLRALGVAIAAAGGYYLWQAVGSPE